MLIQINGESREWEERSTLDDLVSQLSLVPARIAIELNQKVIRRGQWAQTTLADGDRIEIVHFVGGGSRELAFGAQPPAMRSVPPA